MNWPKLPGQLMVAEATAIRAALPYSTTWANRAALVAAGQYIALFTDVGVGGGSVWNYSGGRWRPYGGRATLKNTTSNPNNNTSSKIVLDYVILLPGLFQDGDVIRIQYLKERTGGTSDTDATDTGIGTVAATFGNTLGQANSALATTSITLGNLIGYRRESATSVRRCNIASSTNWGVISNANTPVTVPDMDANTTYLQISSQLTSAAGEVSWLRTFFVELFAGA